MARAVAASPIAGKFLVTKTFPTFKQESYFE